MIEPVPALSPRPLTSIARDHVNSVATYVQRVIDISYAFDLPYGNIWFRGIKRSSEKLVPGVIWRGITDEQSVIEDFLIGLPAYSTRHTSDPWDQYCLMQHHGLPTRLLDWTKAPLAALFFALDFNFKSSDLPFDPMVWVLNPYQLNYISYADESLYVPNTNTGDAKDRNLVNSYLPKNLRPAHAVDNLPRRPIAIEPPFSNPRVSVQQGCFTVHGEDKLPINEIPGIDAHLIDIKIEPTSAPKMRNDLEQLGFTGEWLYQDIDRMCRRITEERTP